MSSSRDLMAEFRARLRGGPPGIVRFRADLAERARLEREAAERAAADRETDRGGPAPPDLLRDTLRRKLESGTVRVRGDGRLERRRDFQGGGNDAA